MGKNIIFTFSGTGNSLWAAGEIAGALEDCTVAAMTGHGLEGGYDSIGFVYPTYYRGIPAQVRKFVSGLDLRENREAYVYAVSTCGNVDRSGNSIAQLRKLLEKKGVRLHYARHLGMFSNYVVMYDMKDDAEARAERSAADLAPMLRAIAGHEREEITGSTAPLQQLGYLAFMRTAPRLDRRFRVSAACTSCGICQKVCPAGNIVYTPEGRPDFQHRCEQCLACLHNCPVRAIDYGDRTGDRGRYTHPAVSWRELAELNAST